MSQRKIPLVPGEYFHVYNRGNSKQKIFLDEEDRNRFIKLLYIFNSQNSVSFRDHIVGNKIDAWLLKKGDNIISIGAWVLMPNHFHLYITSPRPGLGGSTDEGEMSELPISKFVRKVCVGYSSYFNKKYNRTGTLFEGRFKAVHIDDDIQAKYLFSYIHLNPIKLIDPTWKIEGIKDIDKTLSFLNDYKWSSYLDYLGEKRKEGVILNTENFPNYFSDINNFNKEILEWLKYKES